MDLKPIFMYAFVFSSFFSQLKKLSLAHNAIRIIPDLRENPLLASYLFIYLFIYACIYSFIYFAHKVIRFTQDLREKPLLATNLIFFCRTRSYG
jgi:hypothetical protein